MSVDLNELRSHLLKWARQAGAPSPEDAVQAVMTRAMEGGLTHTWPYWMVAARNEARNQQKKAKRGNLKSLDEMIEGSLYDVTDPHDSVPQFILSGPDADWLRDYYGKRNHSGAEKIMAMRKRRKLRASIQSASKAKVIAVRA